MGQFFAQLIQCLLLAGPAEAEAERWFREWATLRTPPAIEAEFVSSARRLKLETPLVYRGRWRNRFAPAFGYDLEMRKLSGERLLEEERLAWDSAIGEGRTLQRWADTLVTSAVLSAAPPAGAGQVELPVSGPFYAIDDRPLASYLKVAAVTVRILDASGSRFVVFLARPGSRSVDAYVLDRTRQQPIEETRVYVSPEAVLATVRNPRPGFPIDLPAPFAGKVLFVVRRVLESAEVGGWFIPVRWEVSHCLLRPAEETVISLSGVSIRNEPAEGPAGLLFDWPAGALLHDAVRGAAHWVGEDRRLLTGEVLKESALDAILAAAGVAAAPGASAEKDRHQETNCAANAAYLALALAGRPEPLRGIVGALGVSGAAEETSLEAIRRLFAERGIGSSAAQGGAEVLGLLGSGFALLHARREKSSPGGKAEVVGHYLVVDDYDPVTGTLRVYDPPVLPYRSLLREVLKPWSGHALLFGDAERALSRRNRGLTAAGVGLLAGSAVCFLAFARKLRRNRAGGLLGLLLLLPACGGAGGRGGGLNSPGAVSVVGSAEFDFGEVRLPAKDVAHTFILENALSRPLSIASIKKSCACLAASVEPKVLPPRGRAEVKVEIEGRVLAGVKSALAVVEFEDREVAPITLSTRALFVADYRVSLAPLLWTVGPEGGRGTPVHRTFQVTEFLSGEPKDGEETRVESASPEAAIESVGPWKNQGWRPGGFARETEIRVAVRLPEGDAADREIVLRFDRTPAASTLVTVTLRVL